MRRFGKPKKPFYIVLSRDDRALWLSNAIAGGAGRVGDTTDVAELADLGATVIDLTDLKGTDASNHGKFEQLASVAPQLGAVLAAGIGTKSNSSSEASADGNPLSSLVTLPVNLLGAPIKIIADK